jgi:hypothetical protein
VICIDIWCPDPGEQLPSSSHFPLTPSLTPHSPTPSSLDHFLSQLPVFQVCSQGLFLEDRIGGNRTEHRAMPVSAPGMGMIPDVSEERKTPRLRSVASRRRP